jgi:hypothetical protein
MTAPFLKVVAGTAFAGKPAAPEQPAQGRRKHRGPYKDHKPIEYQDGLPVIDPAGEQDGIFRRIADHREEAAHYERCVSAENDAEGKASAEEFAHLQANSHNAFKQMMLFARALILCRPTTRRGLIHQARYLASQFNDFEGCEGGCMYLPDSIDEQRWPMTFLQSLAAGLRKMAGEFDPANEGGEANA